MSELLSAFEALSKIVALISASVAAIGLLIQYRLKVKEELRLRDLATLEMDVRISNVFSELVSVANGYGGWSEPQSQIIEEILKSVPQEIKQQLILSGPSSIGKLVSGARIPKSVPLSQQLAASESLANLAIRYPFLLEPALVGLDVVAGFMKQAKDPYNRLCTHYKISRPLTDWGFVPGEPNYGYKSQNI
jgi:hypothetical protein